LGDAPYGYVVAILSKAGLSDRDVQWIPVGQGVAGRAAALTSGRADATILTAPAYFKLETDYTTLANLAEREDIFASTAYTMAKKDLQPDTKLAEALIKAHAEAIKKFYEDKPADEVAAALGLTAGNVRVIRHRGLERLRDCVTGAKAP